jgi:hypothetical protein
MTDDPTEMTPTQQQHIADRLNKAVELGCCCTPDVDAVYREETWLVTMAHASNCPYLRKRMAIYN